MARTTVHVCSECGFQSAKWHGQCPGCEAWNTLVEEAVRPKAAAGRRASAAAAHADAAGDGSRPSLALVPRPLHEVGASAVERMSTGIGELDRVLGGGLVPGSLVLLGGSPGIGKSTLTNMVLGHLQGAGHKTLYVSGEESAEQVRLRAERLAPGALHVPVLAETDLDAVLDTLAAEAPDACVIDSVQTLCAADPSKPTRPAPGSVGQVREVAARIMNLAKSQGVAVILVGHVTKDGALAGPRVLEHLVDCVLQFEGERERPYRELRALKNRFGSTNEAGLFEMRQGGLVEVLDASARFVAEATCAPGSVVLAAMEGSRPLLVEVQALVAPSELEQPRRVVSGLDRNRLALVLAILGRHGKIRTGGSDVFVNVVGGVRVDEPGCDLAVALAVASASRGIPLKGTPRACFGELGLTGELRWVGHPERRLEEAAKHGLHGVIAPPESGSTACEVTTLRQALAAALPGGSSAGRTRSRAERGDSPVALVGESEGAPAPRILRPAPELDAHERAQLVAAGEECDDPTPP
ncbi:MAG TPA: DNA repair protein RadA [Solirubrobacteraceae bacterium]|jgi:DNA repair protein RadA/Sms|nr:DNA repair protein RadA [Solirubrobacteraceae bacterium]